MRLVALKGHRIVAMKPMVSSAIELFRPFRAMEHFWDQSPGRCPGLDYSAPLGRSYWCWSLGVRAGRRNFSKFAQLRQILEKCEVLKCAVRTTSGASSMWRFSERATSGDGGGQRHEEPPWPPINMAKRTCAHLRENWADFVKNEGGEVRRGRANRRPAFAGRPSRGYLKKVSAFAQKTRNLWESMGFFGARGTSEGGGGHCLLSAMIASSVWIVG